MTRIFWGTKSRNRLYLTLKYSLYDFNIQNSPLTVRKIITDQQSSRITLAKRMATVDDTLTRMVTVEDEYSLSQINELPFTMTKNKFIKTRLSKWLNIKLAAHASRNYSNFHYMLLLTVTENKFKQNTLILIVQTLKTMFLKDFLTLTKSGTSVNFKKRFLFRKTDNYLITISSSVDVYGFLVNVSI